MNFNALVINKYKTDKTLQTLHNIYNMCRIAGVLPPQLLTTLHK